jgi:hypothetical protein
VRTSILLAALVLLFSVSSSTQEVQHAPTVAQCQADQALWLSKLQKPHGRGTDDVGVTTMHKWQSEMNDCQSVDPANRRKYYETIVEAISEVETREMAFIYRHGLYPQFVQEDEAGKRGLE